MVKTPRLCEGKDELREGVSAPLLTPEAISGHDKYLSHTSLTSQPLCNQWSARIMGGFSPASWWDVNSSSKDKLPFDDEGSSSALLEASNQNEDGKL